MNIILTFFTKLRKPKLYIKIIMSALVLLLSFHGLIWYFFTKQLLDTPYPYYIGDLARLSYQINSIHTRKINDINLKKRHLEIRDWKGESAPINTLGDSFSQGAVKGKNPYYQDYIATDTNQTVLNISPGNYFETIMNMLNNGLLKDMQTKIIIIESVERHCVTRFSRDINWETKLSKKAFLESQKHNKELSYKQKGITFINNANYKFIRNSFLYSLTDTPYKIKHVYKAKLDKEFFSVKSKDTLLFLNEDIKHIDYSTPKNIKKLNTNLNYLAKILLDHNIHLVFMPIVDKYNLYYPYISNNNLPKSQFFELLKPLEKDYYYIDTKALLTPLLKNGMIDLYYADDTHWSYKASESISKTLSIRKILYNNKGDAK